MEWQALIGRLLTVDRIWVRDQEDVNYSIRSTGDEGFMNRKDIGIFDPLKKTMSSRPGPAQAASGVRELNHHRPLFGCNCGS